MMTGALGEKFSLVEGADLAVYFVAEKVRYDPEYLRQAGMTSEFFIAYYSPCPSLGFLVDGRQIGGMIFDRGRSDEVHFAVLHQYHGRWHSLWIPALRWLFAQQDPVYATVERFNEKCVRFMDRNRFTRAEVTETQIRYRMSAADLPSERTAGVNSENDLLVRAA